MRRWPAGRPGATTLWLSAAAIALVVALVNPGLPGERQVYDYLFVIDISQSMLVRDYLDDDGQTVSRLEIARQAVDDTISQLPCGSRVGVGLFTGWNTATAFRPIEVCGHRDELASMVERVDWRMTWVPQSNIARGLFTTIEQIHDWPRPPALIFLTDGDEMPAVDEGRRPDPPASRDRVRGVLVGVGATSPSPVPKFGLNGDNRGFFTQGGEPLTSRLAAGYLETLAADTGFGYARLNRPGQLAEISADPAFSRPMASTRGIGWAAALLALACLVWRYLRPHRHRLARRGAGPVASPENPAASRAPRVNPAGATARS